jgi:hypothetical protein
MKFIKMVINFFMALEIPNRAFTKGLWTELSSAYKRHARHLRNCHLSCNLTEFFSFRFILVFKSDDYDNDDGADSFELSAALFGDG